MDPLQPAPIKQTIIYKQLFKDRKLIVLAFSGILLALLISLRILLTTTSYDIDIPIRYTEFGVVDNYITGRSSSHYVFILFAVVTVTANTLLALRIYRHRRWASLVILSLQLIVLIFLYKVSGAIIGTSPVAG